MNTDNTSFKKLELAKRLKKVKLKTNKVLEVVKRLDRQRASRQERINDLFQRISLVENKIQQTKKKWGVE